MINLMRLRARFFVLLALAGCGERIIEAPAAPDRPGGLRATLVSPQSVRLEWNAVTTGDGITYSVYRNETKIADVSTTEYVDSAISSNTSYTWFVSARTREGGLSAPSDPVTLAIADILRPTVTATTPANAASGLSRLPAPTITFSEPMIASSVTSPGAIIAKITSSGDPVYGTVNYDSATRTADFWPLTILPARTSITITVTAAVRDLSNNAPSAPFSFSFTTSDTPASNADLPTHEEQLLVSAGTGTAGLGRDIFKMRVDGSGRVDLTSNSAQDLNPSWSPDGRHIVFSSDRNGSSDIFLMRDNGKGVQRLTSDAGSESRPRWAPDGQHIVFLSNKEGVPPAPNFNTPSDVWIMNGDGTRQVNLSKTPSVYEDWPHISPDGTKLLFTRIEVSTTGFIQSPVIMVSNADGSNARSLALVHPDYVDDVASWSPDGSQIAFSAFDHNPPCCAVDRWALFVANADGTNVRKLLYQGMFRFPAWSPDGSTLLFSYSSNEFWGRFGEIGAGTFNLATSALALIAPLSPATEVMSPQAWRR
jgi:TolB protein